MGEEYKRIQQIIYLWYTPLNKIWQLSGQNKSHWFYSKARNKLSHKTIWIFRFLFFLSFSQFFFSQVIYRSKWVTAIRSLSSCVSIFIWQKKNYWDENIEKFIEFRRSFNSTTPIAFQFISNRYTFHAMKITIIWVWSNLNRSFDTSCTHEKG